MASLPTDKSSASFWHSEPSTFLLGHCTTSELPKEADIVVVGSGITGASAARFLAEDGRANDLSIVMLEAREACWGATGRNGGHCQPLLYDCTPDIAAFEVKNCNTVRSFVEDHNVPCEWRTLSGCRTFWTKELADLAARKVEHLKRAAPELGKKITLVEEVGELHDYRVNGAAIATITESAGSLWPYKLVAYILENLIKDGRLNLQTKTPVNAIKTCENTSIGADNGWLLHTPRGTIKATRIILATNAYTSHLLPEFTDLIVPGRGMMTALLPPKKMTRLQTSYGFVGMDGTTLTNDDYLNQRPFAGVPNPAGHLMFGGGQSGATRPSVGETDDSIVDEGCFEYLRKELLKRLFLGGDVDGLKELSAAQQWSGIWGTSRDRYPWVGAVPERPGIWLAGGYSGHGMPNATLSGKAVVEMLLEEKSGAPADYTMERLIRTGNLPEVYNITKERMQKAAQMESVQN
ncbi:MAG: hypothetical protein Q9170_003358 [Blastenia crenularia]